MAVNRSLVAWTSFFHAIDARPNISKKYCHPIINVGVCKKIMNITSPNRSGGLQERRAEGLFESARIAALNGPVLSSRIGQPS